MRGRVVRAWPTAAAVASLLTVLGAITPAAAQPSPTPGPATPSAAPSANGASQRVSFGIQAASPTHPDSRSILSYNATPGVVINDYVAVSNIAAAPVTLAVYGTDASNAPDGKVVFAPVTQKATQAGAWVTVGGNTGGRVAIPGRTTAAGPGVVIVPIRIAIPASATPGDHVGAVIASLETAAHDSSGVPVQLDQRIAERIYIRVSGPLTPRLAVQNLQVTYHQGLGSLDSGSATVTYTVKNTGNAILSATQNVSLAGWFGASVRARNLPIVPPLLPGNSVRQRVVIPDVAPRIRLRATVSLTATAVVTSQVDPGLKPFQARASTWALPWALLALVVAGLLLGGVGIWWWRRSGSTGGDGDSAGGSGPDAPDDAPGSASTSAESERAKERTPTFSGVVSAVALVVGASVLATLLTPTRPAFADAVPYTDARATGVIGLCDASNHPIHGGSTTSAPFVSRAVGATAAPVQYAGQGRTATLYAYQPRPGVPAGEWSGQQLTASANYTNPAHPMAQATGADDALLAFLTGYQPQVNGLVQLRLYLGAPNIPLYQKHYDATDIQITGTTWSVVRGGDQDCTAGSATSFETTVLPSADLTAPPAPSTPHPAAPSAVASASPAAAAPTGAPVSASAPVRGTDPALAAVGLSVRTKTTPASSSRGWWSVVAVLVLLLVVGALLVRRRFPGSRNTPHFSGNTTTRGNSE